MLWWWSHTSLAQDGRTSRTNGRRWIYMLCIYTYGWCVVCEICTLNFWAAIIRECSSSSSPYIAHKLHFADFFILRGVNHSLSISISTLDLLHFTHFNIYCDYGHHTSTDIWYPIHFPHKTSANKLWACIWRLCIDKSIIEINLMELKQQHQPSANTAQRHKSNLYSKKNLQSLYEKKYTQNKELLADRRGSNDYDIYI